MDAREFAHKTGVHRGKPHLAAIICHVVAREGRPLDKLDRKRVKLLAQKFIEQHFPVEQRKGVVVQNHNVNQTIQDMKRRGDILPAPTAKDDRKITEPAPTETAPQPAQDSYTREELLAAFSLLRKCGRSPVKAHKLLDLVSVIGREE